jgi:hypothetical protein
MADVTAEVRIRMQACRQLRGFCRVHEWAGGTAALLGVGLLLGTIWVGIDYQIGIRAWVAANPLPHALAFGALTLVDVLVIFGLLCLGFSECAPGDRNCIHAYRGRRSVLFPEVVDWLEALGQNPRRLPRKT